MKAIRSIGALAAAALAAVGSALGCSPGPGPGGTGGTGGAAPSAPAWQVVYEGTALGGAVLSVWGPSASEVFVVGGPLGNGGNAVAWHLEGSAWKSLGVTGTDSFWWVTGTSATDVWMSGEKGRLTHWDGSAFTEMPRLTTATIWGVWAKSPTEAWAVGGTPGKGMMADNDVVLRWDGKTWAKEALPMPLGRSLNKVWGTSSEDLYAVGEYGTVWHRKGSAWANESMPPVAKSNLLTVFGCSATDVYAVGGQDVIHSDGTTWSPDKTVMLTNSVNGVTCGAPGEVLIVGFGGLKQRLVKGAWVDEFDQDPTGDLHGSWADGQGSFWVAGGDFISKASPGKARKATVARYGKGHVSTISP
jgi:hypothetical protein